MRWEVVTVGTSSGYLAHPDAAPDLARIDEPLSVVVERADGPEAEDLGDGNRRFPRIGVHLAVAATGRIREGIVAGAILAPHGGRLSTLPEPVLSPWPFAGPKGHLKLMRQLIPLVVAVVGCAQSAPLTKSLTFENGSSGPVAVTATGPGGRIDLEAKPGERVQIYGAAPEVIGTSIQVRPKKGDDKTLTVTAGHREWERGYAIAYHP